MNTFQLSAQELEEGLQLELSEHEEQNPSCVHRCNK
jgi:hypothetical protein